MSATGYETFEITGPQMVLVMKLTTFAWNVWDGRRRAEVLNAATLMFRLVDPHSLSGFRQMAAANEGGSVPFIARVPGIRVGPHPYSEQGTKLMISSQVLFPRSPCRSLSRVRRIHVFGQRNVVQG